MQNGSMYLEYAILERSEGSEMSYFVIEVNTFTAVGKATVIQQKYFKAHMQIKHSGYCFAKEHW